MLILKQNIGVFFQFIYIRRQKLISTFVEISTSPPSILRGKTVAQTDGRVALCLLVWSVWLPQPLPCDQKTQASVINTNDSSRFSKLLRERLNGE